MKKLILVATMLFAMFSTFARDSEFITIFNQGSNEEINVAFYDDFTYELAAVDNEKNPIYLEGTYEFREMFGMNLGVLHIKNSNETMGLIIKDGDITLRVGEKFFTGGKIFRNPKK